MKTFLIVIVVVLVVVGGLVAAAMRLRTTFTTPVVNPTVRVETIRSGELIEIVSAPGEVQPRTKVSISAKVSAPIIDLPLKEGDRVYKDKTVLVRLDAKDLEAALKSAQARRAAQMAQIQVSLKRIEASKATIQSMDANLKDVYSDLLRQKNLLATSDVSPSIVGTAQAKYDSMLAQLASSKFSREADEASLLVEKAQLDAAEADESRAKDDLSYTTIIAPIDGVVTRRQAEKGEIVVPGIQGSPGSVIMEIGDLTQMLMVARIDEGSVMQVERGQHAKVRMEAFPDKVFGGTVEWVANSRTDPTAGSGSAGGNNSDGTRYFECKIRLDTQGQLVRQGLSADADIEVKHYVGLRVPSQAVVGQATDALSAEASSKPQVDKTKTTTTVVFRLVGEKAVLTPVSVGASDETHTLITSGLKPGDQVIVGPYKDLETMTDGQGVKAETATSQTPPTTAPAK